MKNNHQRGEYGPPQDPQELYPMKPMGDDRSNDRIEYYPDTQQQYMQHTQPPLAVQQVVVQHRGPKPPNNLLIAIISILFNPIFGAMAVLFSLMSNKAFHLGHSDLARRYGRFAMITAVIGICLSATIGIIAAIVNASYLGSIGGY